MYRIAWNLIPVKFNHLKVVSILSFGFFFLSFIFIFEGFIIHHIVLYILLFYCGFLMLSGFDQLKNQFIRGAPYIVKLYNPIRLQNRAKVIIHASFFFDFSLVLQKRFYGSRMSLKNLFRWVSARIEENWSLL